MRDHRVNQIRLSVRLGISILMLVGSLSGGVPTGAFQNAWVDPTLLAKINQDQDIDFLVVLRSQVDLSALDLDHLSERERGARVYKQLQNVSNTSQAPLIALLERSGAQFRSYSITNVIAVRATPQTLKLIAAHPAVHSIVSNAPFFSGSSIEPKDSVQVTTGVEWNIDRVHAPQLWNLGYTGQGMIYAVADTGVDWDHPALIYNYRGWDGNAADHNYNWWDAVHADLGPYGPDGPTPNPCGYSSLEPCDDNGHGTHVLGTGVGYKEVQGQIGIAPGATWIACRNMEANFGTPQTYIECLQFFLAPTDLQGNNPDPSKRPHVISNSYTCPPIEGCDLENLHVLQDAVEALVAAGSFMVGAAGNAGLSGCGTVDSPPALEEAVFTIGSTDFSGNIANSSSRGPVTIDGSQRRKPDLVAPGVAIRSSIPGGGYGSKSGTSMAAPHVAGAVVLLWSAVPGLVGDVSETQRVLEDSAIPLFSDENCGADTLTTSPNNVYGAGLLDILSAYASTLPERVYLPSINQ